MLKLKIILILIELRLNLGTYLPTSTFVLPSDNLNQFKAIEAGVRCRKAEGITTRMN